MGKLFTAKKLNHRRDDECDDKAGDPYYQHDLPPAITRREVMGKFLRDCDEFVDILIEDIIDCIVVAAPERQEKEKSSSDASTEEQHDTD